jgi:hypothetical protein
MVDSKSKPPLCNVPDINRVVSEDTNLNPEAGQFSYTALGDDYTNHSTLTFVDANASYMETVQSDLNDEVRNATNDDSVSLGDFFSRPVKIHTMTWNVGSTIQDNIKPWQLWATNKRVSNRLSNFKNFRGILHVKYIINGNQFYFGRMMSSYTPFQQGDFIRYTNSPLDINPASQRPHIYLDPSSSQGGELVLPFFWPEDCLNMTAGSNFSDMGDLWHVGLTTLEHTQNVSNPVTISVYAWCTEVKLTSPTQVNFAGLQPQSGDDGEFQDAPPTAINTALEKIKGGLEIIPKIAALAVATQKAFTQMAMAAAAFGLSRPRIIANTSVYQNWQTGNLAATDAPDTSKSLGLTLKQEVTIDPRIVGLGDVDELSFKHLSGIESLYTSFPWNYSDAIDYPLFSTAVTPLLTKIDSYVLPPSAPAATYPPMGMVALPFQFWRGSIKFRFQLACSGYHKGRLLIVWDPVLGSSSPEENTVYSRIVDIAEVKDFSITVGWGDSKPGLDTTTLATAAETSVNGNIFIPNSTTNGVLTVYVLNSLVTAGANTSPITTLVSASSPDLQVWAPDADRTRWLSYHLKAPPMVPESGVMQTDEVPADENAAPHSSPTIDHVGSTDSVLPLGLITSGEVVSSFRQCMKRYAFERMVGASKNLTGVRIGLVTMQGAAYPIYRGEVPSGGLNQGGTFNEVSTTIHSYVCGAFSQWRGSTRFKLYKACVMKPDYMVLSRGGGLASLNIAENFLRDFDNRCAVGVAIDDSWSGSQITTANQSDMLDFELPFYIKTRCAPTKFFNATRALGWTLRAWFAPKPSEPNQDYELNYMVFRSVGEDFNVFFFLGVPPMWYTPTQLNT